MAKITIDGKDYESDDLPKEAIEQLIYTFCGSGIAAVGATVAALQTARNAMLEPYKKFWNESGEMILY